MVIGDTLVFFIFGLNKWGKYIERIGGQKSRMHGAISKILVVGTHNRNACVNLWNYCLLALKELFFFVW